MGLFSSKPKIKVQTTKKDGFSGWLKCSHCSELIHANELEKNLHCCPKCTYHYRLSAPQRIDLLTDEGTFKELFTEYKPIDPLNFVDSKPYKQRLEEAQNKTNRHDAVVVGTCEIHKRPVALGILDFAFMGGSMGSVVGEKLCLIIEFALKEHLPLVLVSASGGARMQESILSLMQMAKTSAALARYQEIGSSLHLCIDEPDYRGRYSFLCHSWRYHHGRARCPHRICRSSCCGTNDTRKTPSGRTKIGIFARKRND